MVFILHSIGSNGSLVSVTTFSTYPKTYLYLNNGQTTDDIVRGVMDVKYGYGHTNLADGLQVLREEIFTEENGDRKDVQNIAIVVMDGVCN